MSNERVAPLARQIEKLSWMLEWMENENIEDTGQGNVILCHIEDAEKAWLARGR